MAVEDVNGEVKFSTHLPYPNNLSRSDPVTLQALFMQSVSVFFILSMRGSAVLSHVFESLFFRTLLELLESLLQLMLKWDPILRGGKISADTKRPKCFEVLEQILSMKVSYRRSRHLASFSPLMRAARVQH